MTRGYFTSIVSANIFKENKGNTWQRVTTRTIHGVRYDRALLEAAEERIYGQRDGRISQKDAEEIVELSKDGGRITETELRTLKYISENYHFTQKAAAWFAGKLPDIEQSVDPDQFDQAQSLTQQQPELDQASSPLPEQGQASSPLPEQGQASSPLPEQGQASSPLPEQGQASSPLPEQGQASSPLPEQDQSTVTTSQSEEFTPVEEPIVRIPHLIWGVLLFVAILVGVVLYQGAIKEIETLELKLSAVPSIQEMEQQVSDFQSERSALQTIVSELKQKVAETNSDQAQFQKGLRAEQDKLASASSEITNLRS